ncbi:hypothetical protein HJFPF1_08373 [Paramyrothecium foliicola]|nr:hypothetical protein HJFPF1_08373 [Paramyrothecium foliicola]
MPYHSQDPVGMMPQRQAKLRRVMPNPQPPSPRQYSSSSQGSTPTFRPPQWRQGSMSSEPNMDTFASNEGFDHHHFSSPACSMSHENAPTSSSLDTWKLGIQYQLDVIKKRLDSMETNMATLLSTMADLDSFHSV